MAFALGRAAPAQGDEPGEPAIGGAIRRIDEQAAPAAEVEPGADDEAHLRHLRRHMGAHHAGQAVAVGQRKAREAEGRGGDGQLLRMRGAAQEGEIAGRLQLGIGGLRGRSSAKPPFPSETLRHSAKRESRATSETCGPGFPLSRG